MSWPSPAHFPYCGPAASPALLWSRWNFDPVLIAALAAVALLYALGSAHLARRGGGPGRGERAGFYAGWCFAALALMSPLCALSVSLFAARVGQHMILTLLAAPLVALGRPGTAIAAVCGLGSSSSFWTRPAPLAAAGLFAALLWLWHAPGPYAATFASTPVYWAMHLSLFGSALWLWQALLAAPRRALMRQVAAGVISSTQMGLLGALITLAARPLYTPHLLTTAAWGLGPLQDQQLGGGIMWVPGCFAFLAAAALAFWPIIARGDLIRAAPAGGGAGFGRQVSGGSRL
ncbi:MAG: cytochrome c oxidase assembly protein [Alphaproteobacteria bacterium]|nr:cytochrome c oxidase assembly protein [Alphaproteobacteria bacterium]